MPGVINDAKVSKILYRMSLLDSNIKSVNLAKKSELIFPDEVCIMFGFNKLTAV